MTRPHIKMLQQSGIATWNTRNSRMTHSHVGRDWYFESHVTNHKASRPRSFLKAGFRPRIPSFIWFVPLNHSHVGRDSILESNVTSHKTSVATCKINTLQRTATHCNTLQHTATHCNTLQHPATPCYTLQHTATHCNILQHTATHCNILQHTATHCNKTITRQMWQHAQTWRGLQAHSARCASNHLPSSTMLLSPMASALE